MAAIASDRSTYVPITGRRRAATVGLVALLYLIAALVLLNLPDRAPIRVVPPTRTFVELLPAPKPPERVVAQKLKPDPADNAVGQQRLKPARVTVDAPPRLAPPSPASAPLSAAIAPLPLPSTPDLTPLATAPSAPIPYSGGGDRVDNGTGGTGQGGNGAGGNNGGGGGGGRSRLQLARAEWAYVPKPAELGRFHPPAAAKAGIGGTAVLTCQVRLNLRAHNCQVLGESPQGYGFGRAALNMESIFRIRPVKVNRKPIDDGWVRLSIRFDLE